MGDILIDYDFCKYEGSDIFLNMIQFLKEYCIK